MTERLDSQSPADKESEPVKPLSMPYANRMARKAVPTGCGRAWWYFEQNGDIAIYGSDPTFSCVIKARSLDVVRKSRVPSTRGVK